MLPLLHVEEPALVLLELHLRVLELTCHFVVPLFDTFQDALIFVMLVLADLLFCLLDLFFFKCCKLSEVIGQLFEP